MVPAGDATTVRIRRWPSAGRVADRRIRRDRAGVSVADVPALAFDSVLIANAPAVRDRVDDDLC
jgi:hypothetical protein